MESVLVSKKRGESSTVSVVYLKENMNAKSGSSPYQLCARRYLKSSF